MLAGLVDDGIEESGLGEDAHRAVAEFLHGFRDGHDGLAADVEFPAFDDACGERFEQAAEADLVQGIRTGGHEAFTAKDAAEVGLAFDERDRDTRARQQQRCGRAGRA